MSCPSHGNKWSAIAQRFVAANVLRLPNKWPMSDFTPRMIKKKEKESGAADQFSENHFDRSACVCPEIVACHWVSGFERPAEEVRRWSVVEISCLTALCFWNLAVCTLIRILLTIQRQESWLKKEKTTYPKPSLVKSTSRLRRCFQFASRCHGSTDAL